MADSAHTTNLSRRRALAAVSVGLCAANVAAAGIAVSASTSLPIDASTDAQLIDLGRLWRTEAERWLGPHLEWKRLDAAFEQTEAPGFRLLAGTVPEDEWVRRYFERRRALGIEDASGAQDVITAILDDLSSRIRAMRATTPAGFAVKARVLRFEINSSWGDSALNNRDAYWDNTLFAEFIAQLEATKSDYPVVEV